MYLETLTKTKKIDNIISGYRLTLYFITSQFFYFPTMLLKNNISQRTKDRFDFALQPQTDLL